MKKLLLCLFINGISLWIIDALFTGIYLTSKTLIIMTIALTLLNIVVKPLIQLLTLPINILTLGVFSLFVNALILLMAFKFVPGAFFNSFGTVFMASIVLSVLNTGLHALFKDN